MKTSELKDLFAKTRPSSRYATMRFEQTKYCNLGVRFGTSEPTFFQDSAGVMVSVVKGASEGYAATSNLTQDGLKRAFAQAEYWADLGERFSLLSQPIKRFVNSGCYETQAEKSWEMSLLKEVTEALKAWDDSLRRPSLIKDSKAKIQFHRITRHFFCSLGSEVQQDFDFVTPYLSATAYKNGEAETRTWFGDCASVQGGWERIIQSSIADDALTIGEQACQLLEAPQCPSGKMDLVLAPDQMILQIHESIGHPLELDRILGDERNYAGTSFVQSEMFGSYQYGSPLLNVSFDPHRSTEIASYQFDDEGSPAQKEWLIKDGILLRGIGGLSSQQRSGIEGVASSRATSWNRPPIDRMANINLEPGNQSLDELIAQVEQGVYMQTNCSWSIDDSRNKFQFGCELGWLIEEGKLTKMLRKPNYRGVSAGFWRNLAGVAKEQAILGTLYCGKGEPNQAIPVGHATPAALFRDIDVFGGEV